MTTYRLFPSTNGPSSPVSYSGNILTGVLFRVTAGGMWFGGYWKWVATGEDVTARKFALWHIDGAGTGTLLPAATVLSGTLTAGQWNFVALANPVQLSIGSTYNACTGWAAVSGHGFSDSDTSGAGTGATDSYGSGGHTAGITQGPLHAFSDQGFSSADPFGNPQGVFGVAGTDATATMPIAGSNNGNFWMDVQVSDTAPAGYLGSYRLWPNTGAPNPSIVADAPDNYEVAGEFALSVACTVSKVWYYSPAAATQLATAANIWTVTGGGLTGTLAATNASPSWLLPSGSAASAGAGWVYCTVTATLPAGKYKAGVYNGAGSPAACFAKDSQTDYWRNGAGGSGIVNGPISAPQLSAASLAYNYNGNAGGTPPYSDGTTLAGQGTFTQGPPDSYPWLVALVATPTAGSTQNYWVDVEVTPVVTPPYPFAALVQRRQAHPRGLPRRGRVAPPVRAQLSPPYPVTAAAQHRQQWARALPRRGRQATAGALQSSPVAAVRPQRQPRGLPPRRGHSPAAVPAQQAAAPNPAITFQQAKRPRVLYWRRGRVVMPVPAQQAAPVNPAWVPVPPRHPRLLLPRRGRVAQFPQAQAAPVAPAWVQSHRAPLRALALIRHRFAQLMPWPQAEAPAFTVGSLTASASAGGATGTSSATYAPPSETTTSP